MKSLEQEPEKNLEYDGPVSPESYCPNFYIDGDRMPEINKWEVGKEYTVVFKVRMHSYDKREDLKGTSSNACLDLVAYEMEEKD